MGKATGYTFGIIIVFSLFFVFLSNGLATGAKESTMKKKYFQGSDAEKMLEQAIRQDSAEGIIRAIKAGANPNTRGLYGVTPLEMAVGDLRKEAVAELLRQGVDMNVRDAEGNNAVTWAVVAYKRDPQILDMLLDAGADPNTLLNDGDPIIVWFLAVHDMDAVRYLHEKGANIDARNRSERPLIIQAGIGEDWDSVWTLLELGAKFDYHYPNVAFTWHDIFSKPGMHTTGRSSLWPFKVKSWKFLRQHGQPVPARLEDLIGQRIGII